MNKDLLSQIRKQFKSAERLLLTSHKRPDGDAVGSLLGLGLALQELGKEVQLVLADGVPRSFAHLVGASQVKHEAEGSFDMIVAVDCADRKRIGEVSDSFPEIDLNIDHHTTNTNFAKINLVDTTAVATAAILAEHHRSLGLPLNRAIAEAWLTGLITDTLGFRTLNMSPKALRVAADLMEEGANLPDLYFQGLTKKSFEAARYWGAGLSRMQIVNGIVWTALTLSDRKASGYQGNDDADLVNVLSVIGGAKVAVIFVQQDPDTFKVSWRGQDGIDVSQVAMKFGGGGHVAAAGAMLKGNLDEVQMKVLQATGVLFDKIPM